MHRVNKVAVLFFVTHFRHALLTEDATANWLKKTIRIGFCLTNHRKHSSTRPNDNEDLLYMSEVKEHRGLPFGIFGKSPIL